MYSKRIEELIDAALEDGVLTEKEKKVLFKNAKAEGIDLDEFEMILDDKVSKAQQTQHPSHQRKEKRGNIIVCPNCGAQVSSLAGICSKCGHEFTGIAANSSAQMLANKIEKISNETKDLEERWNKMASIINVFPIPNTKEDLFELAVSMHSKMSEKVGGTYADEQNAGATLMTAYLNKYKECITKIQTFYPTEPTFGILIKTSKKDIKRAQKAIGQQKHHDYSTFLFMFLVILFGLWAIIEKASEAAN